jgi:hypothetical protein
MNLAVASNGLSTLKTSSWNCFSIYQVCLSRSLPPTSSRPTALDAWSLNPSTVKCLHWHVRLVWRSWLHLQLKRVSMGCSVHDLILIGLRGCLVTRLSDFSESCSVRSCCGSRAYSVECWNVKICRICRWEFVMCWALWSADRQFLGESSWDIVKLSEAKQTYLDFVRYSYKMCSKCLFLVNLLHCASFILLLWNYWNWVWD